MITHSIYLTKEKRWYAGFDLSLAVDVSPTCAVKRTEEPNERLFMDYAEALYLRRELLGCQVWQELGMVITLNMDGGEL